MDYDYMNLLPGGKRHPLFMRLDIMMKNLQHLTVHEEMITLACSTQLLMHDLLDNYVIQILHINKPVLDFERIGHFYLVDSAYSGTCRAVLKLRKPFEKGQFINVLIGILGTKGLYQLGPQVVSGNISIDEFLKNGLPFEKEPHGA